MLLALILLAATGDSVTLDDAVEIALRDRPEIATARAGERIAAARARRAAAAWLPEVTARETWTRGNNPVFVFGSLLEQGRFGEEHFDPAFLNAPPSLTNWRHALVVRYPLFDQLRRETGVATAKSGVSQASDASDATRQEIRARVIRAYFGVELARERVRVATAAVESADAGAKAIRDRVDAGLVARSELLAAEVHLADVRQQKIEAEGDLAIAEEALSLMLGKRATPLTALPDRAFEPPSLEDALQRAGERPDLRRARHHSDDARRDVRAARGSLLPRLDAFGELAASGDSATRRNSDHTFGVALTWNLLDPNRVGRVAEARAAAEMAGDAERSAEDAARLEVVTAWHRHRAAREKLDVGRRAVEHAETAARMIRDRYEQGLVTITEDLRAQAALLRARMSLLAARYETTTGYAELLRAMGGLHDVAPFH